MTGAAPDRRVTLALFAFNQERYVRAAVRAALAQDYSPLDIIISDDASSDDTFRLVEDEVKGYSGPHRILLNRNPENLGVGEHVNLLAGMSNTNFIVLAAGDDIASPQRTRMLAQAYYDAGTDYFYISSNATILDGACQASGRLAIRSGPPDNLARLVRGSAMPLGATEGFTKGLFQFFGPLHRNLTNEDFVLPLRAHLLGRVRYLDMPLVQYRTGVGSVSQADGRLTRRDALAHRAQYLAKQQIAVASMLNDLCFFDMTGRGGLDPSVIFDMKQELCRRLARLATMESFCRYRSQGRGARAALELIRDPRVLLSMVGNTVRRAL